MKRIQPQLPDTHMRLAAAATVGLLLLSSSSFAQSGTSRAKRPANDSAFASMQERGKKAMGVDQYSSTHKFDSYPDGGRIELQRDAKDSAGVAAIRAHIRDIAAAFKSGNFSTPEFVHMQMVPGTKEMSALRSKITYTVHDLPRGAELHVSSSDSAAVAAIHEFMAFQRGEHHASGMMPMSKP
jgi:hypothetical protein